FSAAPSRSISAIPRSQDQSARPRALGAIGPRLAASAKSFKSARMSVPMGSIIKRYQAGSLFGFALKTAKALGLDEQVSQSYRGSNRTRCGLVFSHRLCIEIDGTVPAGEAAPN